MIKRDDKVDSGQAGMTAINSMIKRILIIAIASVALLIVPALANAQQTDAFKDKSVSKLFKELKETKDPKARYAILSALEKKKPLTDEDVSAMVEALDSADLDVQEIAIRLSYKEKRAAPKLLEKVKQIPVTKAGTMTREQEKDYKLKSLAALALSEMRYKKALPVIIEKLGNAPSSPCYDEIILVLSAVNYGKDALPAVRKTLKRGGWKTAGKMRLLTVIMNIKDKEAASELRDMFDDDDPDMKAAAARGLRNIGEKIEVAKLIEKLKETEANPQSGRMWLNRRDTLIDEIGYAGNPDAIPFLKERMEKELWSFDERTNKKSARNNPHFYGEGLALARIGGETVFQYLIQVYEEYPALILKGISPYPKGAENVKSIIIHIFGEGKMKEAIPFLTGMMNDTNADREFRLRAARSLEKITGQDYLQIKEEIKKGLR
jgi:HEAT repeat protein